MLNNKKNEFRSAFLRKSIKPSTITLSLLGLTACGGGSGGGGGSPTGNTPPPAPSPTTMTNFSQTATNAFVANNNGGTLNFVNSLDDLTVTGGSGNDDISTGNGDDIINGLGGNDEIQSSPGADVMDGGDGFDTIDYSNSPSGVTVDLNTNTVSGGWAEGDQISNFESIRLSAHDDVVTTTDLDDTIFLSGGNDILNTRGGEDSIHVSGNGSHVIDAGDDNDALTSSSTGAVTFDGGSGYDSATYVDSHAAVNINLLTGVLTGGTAHGDSFSNVEQIAGSNFDDTLVGGNATITFFGLDGSDNITGSEFADAIYGAEAADDYTYQDDGDIINGLGGDDFLFGHEGNDTINGGEGNDFISGDEGDDILNGGNGDDEIRGGEGMNTINGNGGDDHLTTNGENSILNGGQGNDLFAYSVGNITLNGDAGDDTFVALIRNGFTNVNFDGGADNDTIFFDGEDVVGTTNINLSTLSIENIETIFLRSQFTSPTPDTSESLTLTLQDVLDVTDANDQLIIRGTNADNVNSAGQGWVQGVDQTIDGETYNTYTSGTATLLVDDDIVQVIS